MTLQELQKQALQLSVEKRWQLVHMLLLSLQVETSPAKKKGNLSRLRGIAKSSDASDDKDITADYVTYLTKKYQ